MCSAITDLHNVDVGEGLNAFRKGRSNTRHGFLANIERTERHRERSLVGACAQLTSVSEIPAPFEGSRVDTVFPFREEYRRGKKRRDSLQILLEGHTPDQVAEKDFSTVESDRLCVLVGASVTEAHDRCVADPEGMVHRADMVSQPACLPARRDMCDVLVPMRMLVDYPHVSYSKALKKTVWQSDVAAAVLASLMGSVASMNRVKQSSS